MNNNFDRLLKLAQKTNSTLVVYDRDGGQHCVIVSIDEFEKLSGGVNQKAPALPLVDKDRDSDQAAIEQLNREIAEWRANQPVAEPEEVNTETVQEPETEPESVLLAEAKIESEPKVPPPPAKPSSWYKFGEVMAETMRPKMPEVRYEEIGEPEVALPVAKTDDSEDFSEPEPLDDEPLFLEEPIA